MPIAAPARARARERRRSTAITCAAADPRRPGGRGHGGGRLGHRRDRDRRAAGAGRLRARDRDRVAGDDRRAARPAARAPGRRSRRRRGASRSTTAPGEDHTIRAPAGYERWRRAPDLGGAGPQDGASSLRGASSPTPTATRPRWASTATTTRAIASCGRSAGSPRARTSSAGAYASDITIANWPQLDCETGDPDDARELSLSFLHWLQAEQGLPGLRLRGDVTGTADGLAKALYVRESRADPLRAHDRRARARRSSRRQRGHRHLPHRPAPADGAARTNSTSTRPVRDPARRAVPVRWRTCCPGPRTSARPTSPTAAIACIRSSGTSARPPARSPPSASGARCRPREVRARPALREAYRERLARDGDRAVVAGGRPAARRALKCG